MQRKCVANAEAPLVPGINDHLTVEHLGSDLKVLTEALAHLSQGEPFSHTEIHPRVVPREDDLLGQLLRQSIISLWRVLKRPNLRLDICELVDG